LKDLGVEDKIILERIFKQGEMVMDWIDLAQDRDRWLVFVNAVMNLWVP
jgi:hypothetical protein